MFRISEPGSSGTISRHEDTHAESSTNHASLATARQLEGLADMLAWIRLELGAERPTGASRMADRDRTLRARGQVDMALAMAKELSDDLHLGPGR